VSGWIWRRSGNIDSCIMVFEEALLICDPVLSLLVAVLLCFERVREMASKSRDETMKLHNHTYRFRVTQRL
jgi:hypothetical protein